MFLWDILPESEDSYVGFDNVLGAASMVNHLVGLGHKRIGFICGIDAGVVRISRRYEGYKKALRSHGIPLDESLVRSTTSSFANGREAMREFMAMADPPRCVCCASDILAMGALFAVWEAGLRVPEDFAVAGFDNSELAAFTTPPLCTVDVPGEEMGRLGIAALFKLIADERQPPVQQELPTSLVLRGSVCPAENQRPLPERRNQR